MHAVRLEGQGAGLANLIDPMILRVVVRQLYQRIANHHMVVLIRAHEAAENHAAFQVAFRNKPGRLRPQNDGVIFPKRHVLGGGYPNLSVRQLKYAAAILQRHALALQEVGILIRLQFIRCKIIIRKSCDSLNSLYIPYSLEFQIVNCKYCFCVPKNLCISGAQCMPLLVAMPYSFISISDTSAASISAIFTETIAQCAPLSGSMSKSPYILIPGIIFIFFNNI